MLAFEAASRGRQGVLELQLVAVHTMDIDYESLYGSNVAKGVIGVVLLAYAIALISYTCDRHGYTVQQRLAYIRVQLRVLGRFAHGCARSGR